jgi:hypothetical protein
LFSYTQIGYHVNKAHSMTVTEYRASFLTASDASTSAVTKASPPPATAHSQPTEDTTSVHTSATEKMGSASSGCDQKQVTTNGTSTTSKNISNDGAAQAAASEVTEEQDVVGGMCLARCKVCRQELAHHLIRAHLQEAHQVIDKYWEKYEFSRKTFYK